MSKKILKNLKTPLITCVIVEKRSPKSKNKSRQTIIKLAPIIMVSNNNHLSLK